MGVGYETQSTIEKSNQILRPALNVTSILLTGPKLHIKDKGDP